MVLAAPKSGGTLIFGRGGDSVGLDPAYETDGNSFLVCDNIYEALVAYKDESTSLVFSIGRMMKDRNVKFFGKGWDIPAQDRVPEYWVSMEMDETIGAIEATGEYTVVFKLKRVEAPFLANMGMDFADIISPTAFMKNPKEFLRNPVGTGPFKFVKWVKDDQVILEKNKDYWDKSAGPYLDKVRKIQCAFWN
jgi:peptide/nickel transport system substrate-binding protein